MTNPPAAPTVQTDVTATQLAIRPLAAVQPPIPILKSRMRNGKIARLPKLERDLVNRMLQNNLSYAKIVGALDEIGITVTERNISNWKTRGGYREWSLAQDHAVQVRLFQDNLTGYLRQQDASQVPEVGLQLAATYLSEFLLQPDTRQQLAADPEKFSRLTAALCRLTQQIHNLQKYRDDSAKELGPKHRPERIKREEEASVERTREAYSSSLPQSPNDPPIPHRNYAPSPS